MRTMLAALLAGAAMTTPAAAAVILDSGATAAIVSLRVGTVLKADAQFAPVGGTGPSAYADTATLASIDQSFALGSGLAGSSSEGLKTRLVSTDARLGAGGTSASATAVLNDATSTLASRLIADLLPTVALGIGADTIRSTTTVGYDPGGIFASGSSTLTGLAIGGSALGALAIDASLYSNPAANTVVLSLPGLAVVLNEQLRSSNAAGQLLAQTNAVHITLSDYLLAGKLLSGDIILGHSQAEISGFSATAAVPEPTGWVTMILGFGAIGLAMRRRTAAGTWLSRSAAR